MKIIQLEQGSPEWLAFRNGDSEHGLVISASRVPSVLKEHAYSGAFSHEVFEEMVSGAAGRDLSRVPAVARGHRLEPMAAAHVNALMGVVGTNPVGISDRYPWLAASFDWYHPDAGVWEIKSPGRKVFERAKVEGIPAYYRAQIETQIIVTDGEFRDGYMLMWPPDDAVEGEEPLELPITLSRDREALIIKETKRFVDDLKAVMLGDESRRWLIDPMEQARARRYRSGSGDTFTPKSDLTPDELKAWNQKMAQMLEARKSRLLLEKEFKDIKAVEDGYIAELVQTLDLYGYELGEDEETGTRITAKTTEGTLKYKELAEHYEQLLGLEEAEAEETREQFRGDRRRSVRVTAVMDKESKPARKKAA